ncbi:ribonuclease 3-like protein 3 [Andrographis paniculata]|uniref:ribonuclease 3-like protein 3 n=1 Tax=Andrographis paniculata TaxID=175694 RepID=UPI0021E93FA2|nr:ribonuclease 3-like protein 3 [Andrographis paniculata]
MLSWWESLRCVAPRRLRRYGNILSNYLNGMRLNGKVTSKLSKEETESESLRRLEEVEKIIGYSFNNRSLLHQAFTHPSYHRDCVSYERLEYVGDSVLNLLIAKEQFFMYPDLPPGSLAPLRAANVDTEKLARAAIKHNFHKYIRYGNSIIRRKIQAFILAVPKYPLHSHGLINVPKVLADVVESTLGAVFIDSNCSMDTTWEVASDLLKPIITPEVLQMNPVRKLFEICQKYKLKVKLVDEWSSQGTYKVYVNNKLRGKGVCWEKKEVALNRAANDAYKQVASRSNKYKTQHLE